MHNVARAGNRETVADSRSAHIGGPLCLWRGSSNHRAPAVQVATSANGSLMLETGALLYDAAAACPS